MICDKSAIFFLGIRKKNPCIYFKSIYILWKQPLKIYSINKISLKDMQVLWNTQKTHALTHKKYREYLDGFPSHFESPRRFCSLRHCLSRKIWACRDWVHPNRWDLKTSWSRPSGKRKIGPLRVLFLSILMKELAIGECWFGDRSDMIGKPQLWLRPDPGQADWRTHRGPERRSEKR